MSTDVIMLHFCRTYFIEVLTKQFFLKIISLRDKSLYISMKQFNAINIFYTERN